MPFSKVEWSLGIDTHNRKFHDMTNTGACGSIDKSVRYLHLVWHQWRKKENFLDAFQRAGKRPGVFKVESY